MGNSEESFDEADMIRSKIIRILDSDPDDPDVAIVLVGNKCDLEHERKVSKEQLNEKQREWKCGIFETSAKEKQKDPIILVDHRNKRKDSAAQYYKSRSVHLLD